jgi:hypothetical protein
MMLVGITTLVGCGDDDDTSTGAGASGGEAGTAGSSGKGGKGGSGGTAGKGGTGGTSANEGGDGGTPTDPSSGGEGGTPEEPIGEGGGGGDGGDGEPEPAREFWECQGSDQAWVRRAIQGVLGRRPYSQAEVNLYTDMIAEIDAIDGIDPAEPAAKPGEPLRRSRKVVLSALFQRPEYASNWEELYRDFLRVQRVDEYQNAACYVTRARILDAAVVADRVRSLDPAEASGGDGGTAPTMGDIIAGSIELDDVTPMYTANLFAMMAKTYAGANGTPLESELGRRLDFGAWFDAVYLNRDPVCLQCHNSEFSVTQSANPETNRHYPIPALLEKALFGDSTGAPPLDDGYDPTDRMHAPFKFARFLSQCSAATAAQVNSAIQAGEIAPDSCPNNTYRRCVTSGSQGPVDLVCESTFLATRNTRPWGWNGVATRGSEVCGVFTHPSAIPEDFAGVNAKFGNIEGTRNSVWDIHASLRAGFNKLKAEGLGADPVTLEVPDPDKAFAYMTAMRIVEEVWKEVVGTPLTIQTYYPRNAAARDQLKLLTDRFIASGYSNKALLEEILASPYANPAPPDAACMDGMNPYSAPRIYDAWTNTADDPAQRGNSVGDAVVMLNARTLARTTYAALGWPLAAYQSSFPGQAVNGQANVTAPGASLNVGAAERQFQSEVGFRLKNTELGFRGFDFQARMGWEDRFARCEKLFPNDGIGDIIDFLAGYAATPGSGTIREAIEVMKDRMMGSAAIEPTAEEPALAAILGLSSAANLDDDLSTLSNPNGSLRRLCGVFVSSPQAVTTGLVPPDTFEVPALTPLAASYGSLCSKLEPLTLADGITVSCAGDSGLTVVVPESAP